MKRYVHPLKSFASSPNYAHLYCKPAVEYCEWTEVQALLRAVADEVKKLPHAPVCSYPMDGSECNCPRGKVLAALEKPAANA